MSRTSKSAMPRPRLALSLGFALLCGCPSPAPTGELPPPASQGSALASARDEAPADCPSEQLPETRAPDVRPEQEHARYWLDKYEAASNERVLLDAAERVALAAQVAALPGGWRDPLAEIGADEELVAGELQERLEWMRGRVDEGKYVELEEGTFAAAAARVEASTTIAEPALRFVVSETQLWCIPMSSGLFTEPVDRDFDRNRCASLHPGELVRSLRSADEGAWIYVEAGHSVGWVEQREHATLEAPLSATQARKRLAAPRHYLSADFEDLRAGSNFPRVGKADEGAVLVPALAGPVERVLGPGASLTPEPLPFAREQLFELAFALLEQPYGWGGRAGQRDCSRYTYDLFAAFDIKLARHSGVQAKLGSRSVDLSELDEDAKRSAIRAAAGESAVLLYMPGHIMLYLGQDGAHDYGISALSEYLTPCEGGEDSVHRLDKVAVTTLELGRGTERRAFIERITRMAVF